MHASGQATGTREIRPARLSAIGRTSPSGELGLAGKMNGDHKNINKSALRTLHILSLFGERPEGLGVTEISERLGFTKTLVHRALATLLSEGYVIKDKSGRKYELGPAMFEFLSSPLPELDLIGASMHCMRALNSLSKETVMLGIPVGYANAAIFGLEGLGPIISRVPQRVLIPLHVSAGSQCLLSMLSDEEIDAYLSEHRPLARFTENTITDESEIWKTVRAIRERGYALGLGDYLTGTRTIAFPLPDMDGRPHGVMSITGVADRFSQQMIQQLLPDFQEQVGRLQRELAGYAAPPILR